MVHHSTDMWFTTNLNQRGVYTKKEVNCERMYNKMVKNDMIRSLGKLMRRMKYVITEKNHSWILRWMNCGAIHMYSKHHI